MGRIVILGAGESGVGSAYLAKKNGFETFVSDFSKIKESYKAQLEEFEIEFEEGGHTSEKILNATEIIKSPGIPDKAPIVVAAHEAGIPVISEIEFAGRYTSAKTICVTGSNGKTTTTTMIYELLRRGGVNVGIGGNIGQSFAMQVATCDFDWYVLELSSFQLDGMTDFKADISILTNITPDHLDRYEYNIKNYIKSKFKVIQNQDKSNIFICSQDDPITIAYIDTIKATMPARTLYVSIKDSVLDGAYINNEGEIECSYEDKEFKFDSRGLQVKGLHNIYNAQMASLAAMIVGVPNEVIADTLREFKGVEHRLEIVGEYNDILYINDSKATNVDSAWYALQGMTRPVVWIAGGTDKGNDYSTLYDVVKGKVSTLICMGSDNSKISSAFEGIIPFIYSTDSMEGALTRAQRVAKRGDCILLSPACASFDLFKNYEDRGEKFKQYVETLNKEIIESLSKDRIK